MPVPTLLPLLLILAAVLSGDPREKACLDERAAFHQRYFATRQNGQDARAPLITSARSLIADYGQDAPRCVGSIYENLIYLYILEEEFGAADEAIRVYLRDIDERATPRSQIAMRFQFGYVLENLGETMESSRAHYDAASRADRAPAHFGIRALVGASIVARSMGDFDVAEAYLNSALVIVEDSIEVHPELLENRGEAMLTKALILLERIDQGRDPTPRDSLVARLDRASAESASILETIPGRDGSLSIAVATRALAAALAGDLGSALERLRVAQSLARSEGQTPRMARYNVYAAGSRIRELSGDHEGARRDAEVALAEAIQKGEIAEHAIALTTLGQLAEAQGDWHRAEAWYRRAVEQREIHRVRLGLQDWSLSRFATMQAPYRGLVRARVALGDIEGGLSVLDQTRARHLRDLQAHIQLRETLAPEMRQSVRVLVDSLERVREMEARAESGTDRISLALKRSQLQAEIEKITGPLPSAEDSLDVRALRQRLGDRTLVTYVVGEGGSIAFVVRADTVLAVHLGVTRAELRASIRGIGALWNDDSPDPSFSLSALHHLYQQVVEPIRHHVRSERVVFIPDVEVASVPFGMLTTGPSQDYATAPYLVRDWAISTELAATLLIPPPSPTPDHDLDMLVLGRSRFGPGFTWNSLPLADLPDVRTESGRVSRYGRTAEVQVDQNGGEAFYQKHAPRSRVIHLASHAEASATDPLRSRIALTPSDDEDGTLYLYEILTTPLQADLVVLSGCSTAEGEGREGEGIVGLQYGMRAAGAAATLATLWEVADGTMSELTDSFYRHLSQGQSKDQALRSAQLAYLATHKGIEASPFFWAAPVLSGDAASIPLARRRSAWWMWALAIGAGLAGLAWWLLPRRTADA